MRSRQQRFKKIETQPDDNQGKVVQIINLMRDLHEMRFVENIARPTAYLKKQKLYIQFKAKFTQLHQLLSQVKKQYLQQNRQNERGNSFKTSVNMRSKYHKEQIRRIENKYDEVFIQGSFKLYYRVAKICGLPVDLEAINIQQWRTETLKEQGSTSCCC